MTPTADTNNPQKLVHTFYSRCDEAVRIIAKTYSATACVVTHWDTKKNGLFIRACGGVGEHDYHVGQFIPHDKHFYCFRVLEFSKPVSIVNTLKKYDDDIREISYMGMPIHTAEGYFGTLCIIEAEPVQDIKETEQTLGKFKEILEGDLALLSNKHINISHPEFWVNQSANSLRAVIATK